MIRAIIVDDEKHSLALMKKLLDDISVVDVVACFDRAVDAKDYVDNNFIDMAIVDIEMPGMNGFEFVNHISFGNCRNNKCAVIFLTAFNIYAVKAFEFNALDYLVKPVSKERLKKTIEKVLKNQNIQLLPPDVSIKCFGFFRITCGNVEVKFRTSKAQELVAFLIHKPGKYINRSEIIDHLWSDFDGDKAIINFNTTLCYAKKTLLKHNIDLPIIYEKGCYKICLDKIDCDYLKFLSCNVEKAFNKDNIAYYENIASLYTGDFLEAHDYSWAESIRMNINNKYLRLLTRIAEYYSSNDDNISVIKLLEEAFILAPMDRDITHTLIRALLGEGYYSLAANYYKAHRKALQAELKRDPDDSIKKLMGIAVS